MDSQMQERFLQHMLTFFSMKPEDGETADAGDNLHGPEQRCPDLPELLGLLRATGFSVQYSDKSDWGGSSHGCRAVIMCKRSGTRVVMDGDGPCTCPPEATLKQYLEQSRAGPPLSRASSPTPSTSSMLEASLHGHEGPTLDVPPPALSRQRTWSRDDNAILEEGPAASPANRRLSAPPLQMSAWTTMNGDELNVMAATDLLQEAMSLLSGVKKVNLRNTPVGPSRRLSGTAASRRLSSDAFVMPMRPLSRTSSASSGLASSRSTSSLQSAQSTQSSHHGDTPRPGREVQAGTTTTTTLRRTASVNGGRVGGASSAPKTPVARGRTKSDVVKTGVGESSTTSTNTRIPGSKISLIKPPSAVGAGKPTPRLIPRPGINTNASLTSTRPIQPKQIVKSPEVESIKL